MLHFIDKTLTCSDCAKQFSFTAGEQEFFASKALVNIPKRCSNCRVVVRAMRTGRSVDSIATVNCDHCQIPTIVPFHPNGSKPVYCNSCLRGQRDEPKVVSIVV